MEHEGNNVRMRQDSESGLAEFLRLWNACVLARLLQRCWNAN